MATARPSASISARPVEVNRPARPSRPARRPPGPARRTRGARDVALAVLARVRETDAYANRVLPAEIERAGLDARDAGLAAELAYGTLRMRGSVDWVVGLSSSRPVEDIDPAALDALRLGCYQLLYTKIPPHAAVAETVGCLPHAGQAGFVNAVLRAVARSLPSIPWPQPDGDPVSYLQIRHSHPAWICRLWLDELGPHDAERLCAANNVFPGIGVRVNTSRTSPDELTDRFAAARLDVRSGGLTRAALTVSGGGRPDGWPGFAEGHFAVQDEASVLAGEAVAALGGSRIADVCAGPGGKTAHLAAGGGLVAAVEPRADRAAMVRDAVRRLGGRVVVVRGDGRQPPLRGSLDAVLVDAPCTGLGVLRRRPEARWRVRPQDVARSAALQLALLRSAFELVRPGGGLVYAVCTISRAETTGVVGEFLGSEPRGELMDTLPHVGRAHAERTAALQLLPHVHGTDGMFLASIGRTA